MEFYKAALKIVFVLQKNPTKFQQKKKQTPKKKTHEVMQTFA